MTITITWVFFFVFLIILPIIKAAFDKPYGGYFQFPPTSTILLFIGCWCSAATILIMKCVEWLK